MTGRSDGGDGRDALDSLVDLARESVRERSGDDLNLRLQSVSARLAGDAFRARFIRGSLLVASAAAILLLAFVSVGRLRSHSAETALGYTVEGGHIADGGYLRESGGGGMTLAFTEGTTFALQAGTRARLRSVDASSVRLAVEQGTASFQVTPSKRRRWLVDVGPFLVTVKGTKFSVSWDASHERFELRLRSGVVVVSGPLTGGDLTLHAGQRLVADLGVAETRITEESVEVSAERTRPGAGDAPLAQEGWTGPSDSSQVGAVEQSSPVVTRLTSGSQQPERLSRSSAPAADNRSVRDRRWTQSLAVGRWDRILDEASRDGLDATLESASGDDVFALADAARYRRQPELARRSLLTLRRRFPGSTRAQDAVFLLGRVEEASNPRQALRWYDEYLSQTPAGAYASEALGRKMILTNKLEGKAQAQPLAEEYLRRFHDGSYAGAARALWRGQ